MEIAKWVIFVILIGFVTWLTIDTIIMAVKKIKAKKKRDAEKQNQKVQQIDDNDNK